MQVFKKAVKLIINRTGKESDWLVASEVWDQLNSFLYVGNESEKQLANDLLEKLWSLQERDLSK